MNEAANILGDVILKQIETTPTRHVAEAATEAAKAMVEDTTKTPEIKPGSFVERPASAPPPYAEHDANKGLSPSEAGALSPSANMPNAAQPTNNPVEPTPESAEEEEKKRRRRELFGKWLPKFYNNITELGWTFAYDKMVMPKDVLARINEFRGKDLETLKDEEKNELIKLQQVWNAFLEDRQKFMQSAKIQEEMMEEIQELVTDILQVEEVDMSPMALIGFMLLAHNGGNLVKCMSDKMTHNHYF